MDDFEPNEGQIENAVIAYFVATSDATTGDIGDTIQRSEVNANALKLAREIKKQVDNFLPRSRETF